MSHKFSGFLRFLLLFNLFLGACASQQAVPFLNTATAVDSPRVIESPAPTLSHRPISVTSPASCNEKTGSFETGVIDTTLLAKPMRYTVHLPACYSFEASKHYPVLYLLHGQGFTEDQWIRIGAASSADQLAASGAIPPFIIVFPFDYSYKQPTEYQFEDVFIKLLVPAIDSAYRTLPNASHRAIGGLSRGGAWALHIGARHPDMFGAIGGHSPAIFITDEKSLPSSLLAIPATAMPRIWLDAGVSDSEYGVIVPFEEFLSKNNIPHEWRAYVGWHDEKYWSAHVDRYLDWYAQGWR